MAGMYYGVPLNTSPNFAESSYHRSVYTTESIKHCKSEPFLWRGPVHHVPAHDSVRPSLFLPPELKLHEDTGFPQFTVHTVNIYLPSELVTDK